MKKFREWMQETHPEALEEGWAQKALLAGTAAAGLMGAGQMWDRTPGQDTRSVASRQDDFDHDLDDEEQSMLTDKEKLRAAARRVGIPKSQWGNLKGHMTGGIVTVVNGKRVPLTPKEAAKVRAVQDMARSMGN